MINLSDRAIIEVLGPDRKKFLQGLITNDITKVSENHLIYSCMLNAQGRFLYDFFIFEDGEKLMLDCYAPRRDEIVQKFGFYKLRSQITIKKNENLFPTAVIDALPNLVILGAKDLISSNSKSLLTRSSGPRPKDDECGDNEYFLFADPRNNALGSRLYINSQEKGDESIYHFTRIKNKIAESEHDLTYEKSFIAEFGFDNLNAINYNKGCYVGQEPTARIHHLGEIRKEIIYLKLPQKLEKNAEITCEDGSAALVLSSVLYNNEIHALALKKIK